jgi:hypothetical protein
MAGHTGSDRERERERDRERRLRVRVRQIRDVLLTTAPSTSGSGPGYSVTAPTASASVLPRRRPHAAEPGSGAEMDVDVETDDVDEVEAEAEVETDCLTSRAPSRAASPPLVSTRQRRLAIHSDNEGPRAAGVVGSETEIENARTVAMLPHLDLAGVCFDPRGSWLYVASTAGIAEWGVRGGEKRWWAEAVWA